MLRRIIGLGLAVVIIATVVTPIGRGLGSAVLLLPEFFPGVPVRPLELLTPQPEHTTVQLSYDGKTAVGDLYTPGTPGKHGAVIIFLGVAPAGRDDPRVVRLGEGLARVGLVTLVPQSQDLVDSKVDPTEIDEVVSAFQYLAAQPDVAPDRIGIGGFCIGAGLSLDAAEIRGSIGRSLWSTASPATTTFRPTRSAFSVTRLPPTHRSPVRLGSPGIPPPTRPRCLTTT